jgi:hypothetical protein
MIIFNKARVYSRDSLPVMMIRLPRLVRQINNGGSFEKGIFILGLDGSGISFSDIKQSGIQDWIILLDGLEQSTFAHSWACNDYTVLKITPNSFWV